MTTRDETVWDRDARAALAELVTVAWDDGDTPIDPERAVDAAAKVADALASERAKRGGAEYAAKGHYAEELLAARRILGAEGHEHTTDAARRVVRERDAAREVAAGLTAERDEARAALRDAKAALDRILDEDALDDIAHDSTADLSIAAQVRDALATVNRALAAKVSP